MGKNINGDRPTAFPLEQEKLPFTIPVVEEPRPKIAKLGDKEVRLRSHAVCRIRLQSL